MRIRTVWPGAWASCEHTSPFCLPLWDRSHLLYPPLTHPQHPAKCLDVVSTGRSEYPFSNYDTQSNKHSNTKEKSQASSPPWRDRNHI